MKNCIHCVLLISVALHGLATDGHCQQRILSFPSGWRHATLTTQDNPQSSDIPGFLNFQWGGTVIGVAEGEVTVPEDAFVGVQVNAAEGYEEFLSKLPDDGIQRLDLRNIELTNETIAQIERIKSLRQVMMFNCSAVHVDERLLKGLPQMQYLECRQRNVSPETHKAIATWAAKSRQLQFYFDGADLSVKEVRRFAGHEAPLYCKVAFDRNAVEMINALASIPNLVGLNVHVSDDVPTDYHRGLKKLKHLRFANWGGGNLDEEFLNSIAEMEKLSTLRVQGNAFVHDSFVENLSQLKKLEGISFTRLSDHQKQILPGILLGMDNISKLPELIDLSLDQLALLGKRKTIKSLQISGLGDGVTPKQLAEVIERNDRLERLVLRDVSWTPEIAQAIGGCEKLAFLSLDVQDFDGRLIPSPNRLRELNQIHLWVGGKAIGLSVLGKFPSLGSIQISLNTFDRNHWAFIADATSLHTLSVIGGHVDDSIVGWIKQNRSLRNFSCDQCGIMTDLGVAELSQCENLESLTIAGLITESAIQKLAKLPKLHWLSVSTDLMNEEAKQRLKSEFSDLEHFSLNEFNTALAGKVSLGTDRVFRQVPGGGRDSLDRLEGTSLNEMLGGNLTDDLQKRLNGKVVLVEFWGNWCRPCLKFMPELERLQEKYGKRGFQVLAVHSQIGSEKVAAFLENKPKPWPNLIDKDGTLEKTFEVPSFPSTFIFDRDGKMRVAVPFRPSIEQSLEMLLEEVSKNSALQN